MSVQTLDLKVFNYLRVGLEKVAYNNTVDEFYAYKVKRHFDSKDITIECERMIKSWATLNELSFFN